MIIFNIYGSIKNKIISYDGKSRNLIDLLNDIASRHNIKFSLSINQEIIIPAVHYYNKSLETILNDLCELYDLQYVIEDDVIIIKSCEHNWKTYQTKNFHEEKLCDSSSKENVVKFWTEVEHTLNEITDDNFVIDKNNCIIHVFAKQKTHRLVQEYINHINSIKQVIIEIKYIEVIHDNNQDINLLNITRDIINGTLNIVDRLYFNFDDPNKERSLYNISKNVSNYISNKYRNVIVNTSSQMKLLVLSQQTGLIMVAREKNIFKRIAERHRSHNEKFSFSEGLTLTMVPVVLDSDNIMLKINQSIKKLNEDSHNNIVVSNKEINTVLQTKCNNPIVIGGLEDMQSTESFYRADPKAGFFQVITWAFFPKKRITSRKSQIIFLITIDIVK